MDEQERRPFVRLKSSSGSALKGQMKGNKVLEHRELFCIAPSEAHQIKGDQHPYNGIYCFHLLQMFVKAQVEIDFNDKSYKLNEIAL